MRKCILLFTALTCALLFNSKAYAQMDERQPGLYAVVGEESIRLPFSNGTVNSTSTGILGFDIGKVKCTYKGATSGVNAGNTFVLVINPDKKAISKTLKSYDPFVKSMTPDNIRIFPLAVVKNKRIFDEGNTVAGINVSVIEKIDLEWEMISDNSFEIRIPEVPAGEYGFVFRDSKLSFFDYSAIFGFTIAE